ncbi:hypothetical protein JSO19_07235 [Leucobacter sp. UCMA 4100]|uniref:hypothetical protein n=1 Tax=Leucobacter sp. UCMA 4100 TaxID=2810534 RepID=UPI0022EAF6DC|nr:hypothetical protein [Leucobacter sp. UCMA 4100]MDA3147170.1 hypothetical protein [Leucobacter sp. UCMA 4100]
MENDADDAREALDVVEEAQKLNAERLQRPRRYWVMLGLFLSVLALLPYTSSWPVVFQLVVPLAAVVVIAVVVAWKQPTAVRKIKLSGRMVAQLLGFALLAGIIGGLSRAVYAEQGWWWVPMVAAIIMFTIVTTLAPLMDRSWARQVSHIGK